MNFELDEVQAQLRDSVTRMLSDTYGLEQRRAHVAADPGWSKELWRRLGELGATGLNIPESCGGFGGTMGDLLPLLEACGKFLVVEPFHASAVLGATALRAAGSEAQQQRLLPSMATGECIVSWAHQEAGARHARLWVESLARRVGDRWILNGSKLNVLHAQSAHHLVVSARVRGAAGEPDGLALFLVDPRSGGVTLREHKLVDDTPAAEVRLQDAVGEPMGETAARGSAAAAIEQVLRHGTAAACADAVGAMQAAFDLSVSYVNTRRQFGRLIGENQALRHRVAEMLVQLEMSKSMAMLASAAIDDPEAVERGDLVRAKLVVGRNARNLCHSAIQLHGGIGMTEEYAVGHYLRRIVVLEQLYGDSAAQACWLEST